MKVFVQGKHPKEAGVFGAARVRGGGGGVFATRVQAVRKYIHCVVGFVLFFFSAPGRAKVLP